MIGNGAIQIYYGEGKGKTNVAMGRALSAAGEGENVVIVQFLKGKGDDVMDYMQRLEPEVKVFRFEKAEECYEELTREEKDEANMNMKNGLNFAKKVLVTGECDLLILDEVLGLVDNGIVTAEELNAVLQAKTEDTEIILTGRVLAEPLRESADHIYRIVAEK